METNRIYSVLMRIIVLQQFLRATIENFNLLIGAARGQTSAIRMEIDILHHARMVGERVNQ